jgi:FkbM family methyltransferase
MTERAEPGGPPAHDPRNMLVSYAQNFEDVRLNRVFPGATGFYIDVGANDPVNNSVTKMFYDRGWTGINIEPQPGLYRRLCAQRPRDTNLNAGASDAEGVLTFYEAPSSHDGWSTFHRGAAEAYRREGLELVERSTPVTTLRTICERHAPPAVDFLKIDVECHELEVVRGADWDNWRPRVVLIEAGIPELSAPWEPLMESAGYLPTYFDGLNRFYVRHEDRDLVPRLSAPMSVLDNAIPYPYRRLLDQLDAMGEVGPRALGVARRLHALALRHPRLVKFTKRLLRCAG